MPRGPPRGSSQCIALLMLLMLLLKTNLHRQQVASGQVLQSENFSSDLIGALDDGDGELVKTMARSLGDGLLAGSQPLQQATGGQQQQQQQLHQSTWSPVEVVEHEGRPMRQEFGDRAEPSELEHQLAAMLGNQSNVAQGQRHESLPGANSTSGRDGGGSGQQVVSSGNRPADNTSDPSTPGATE